MSITDRKTLLQTSPAISLALAIRQSTPRSPVLAPMPTRPRLRRPGAASGLTLKFTNRGVRSCSSDYFDHPHHTLVFVVDCMTMVNEPADNHWVGKRDDDL
jgi:hypothetical protein